MEAVELITQTKDEYGTRSWVSTGKFMTINAGEAKVDELNKHRRSHYKTDKVHLDDPRCGGAFAVHKGQLVQVHGPALERLHDEIRDTVDDLMNGETVEFNQFLLPPRGPEAVKLEDIMAPTLFERLSKDVQSYGRQWPMDFAKAVLDKYEKARVVTKSAIDAVDNIARVEKRYQDAAAELKEFEDTVGAQYRAQLATLEASAHHYSHELNQLQQTAKKTPY